MKGGRVGQAGGRDGGMASATEPPGEWGRGGSLRGESGEVGRGRGGAGEVGPRCGGEVSKDGAHDGGILNGGDDAQPAATAGTGEDIETERAVHQRGPGPSVSGDDGAGLARYGVWGRAAVAEDLGAPAGAGGEDAVVEQQVHPRTGDEGSQLLEELDGLEEEVGGAIAPDRFEFDEDAAVRAEAETVLGERGAKEIAAELLEAGGIVGGDPDVGVQVEAVEVGLAGAARGEMPEIGLVAEATDAGAGPGAEGDAALDGGAHEASQDGRGLGEWVGGCVVVFRLELAAGEQPPDPGADGGQDMRQGC